MVETKLIPIIEVSKTVRKLLKKHFPKTIFRVHSNKYSGGSSIDVYWDNGPATEEVEIIVGNYEGASFDGSIDLKEYHNSTIISDTGIEEIHFGNDYILCQRRITDDMYLFTAGIVAKLWQLDDYKPENIDYYFFKKQGLYMNNYCYRILNKIDLTEGINEEIVRKEILK